MALCKAVMRLGQIATVARTTLIDNERITQSKRKQPTANVSKL